MCALHLAPMAYMVAVAAPGCTYSTYDDDDAASVGACPNALLLTTLLAWRLHWHWPAVAGGCCYNVYIAVKLCSEL